MISKLFRICLLTALFSSIAIVENSAFVKSEDSRLIDLGLISQNEQKLETSSPSYVELNVPYFSQLDNNYNPTGSSNVTAIAMVLAYYGVQPKTPGRWLPDELYQLIEEREERGWHRHNPSSFVKVAKEYGFQAIFKPEATFQEIKNHIIKGYPVIVNGYFTPSGHVVALVGYTPTHFIANDSWGNANHRASDREYNDKNGEKVSYSNEYLMEVLSFDNSLWATFIYP